MEAWLERGAIRKRGNVEIRRIFGMRNGRIFKLNPNYELDGLDAVGLEFSAKGIRGFSKEYLSNDFRTFGFEFEIALRDLESDLAVVEVLKRGRRVPCEIKVRNGKRLTIVFSDGLEEIELGKGVNLITAKVDSVVSTLTIVQ